MDYFVLFPLSLNDFILINIENKFSKLRYFDCDIKMTEDQILGYVPPPGSQEQSRLLRLKVIAGNELAKKDIFGLNYPYLKIKLINEDGKKVGHSVRTKTKKMTICPEWEEELIFRVIPDRHKLVLEVFNLNRLTGDNSLGMRELPISEMPTEVEGRVEPHKNYILRPRTTRSKVRGHLQLYHGMQYLIIQFQKHYQVKYISS